ncbi:hypothetical protein Zmor_004155 [Zophobas morio]|uniref:Uncharacterized protein n=1 Tax=Zophobas morio TaxID=2755281 RepID=A0AA38M159_9CUCU|nr:hypothetical protein Zmor_004155 [Zophobas morio]
MATMYLQVPVVKHPLESCLQTFLKGSAESSTYKLFLWNCNFKTIEKTLEGTPEPVLHVAFNSRRTMIASVNTIGIALVWSNEREPTWAVYDPGFSEIAENIEYVEEETEFDVLEGPRIPEECPGLSEDSDALIDVEGTSDTDASEPAIILKEILRTAEEEQCGFNMYVAHINERLLAM